MIMALDFADMLEPEVIYNPAADPNVTYRVRIMRCLDANESEFFIPYVDHSGTPTTITQTPVEIQTVGVRERADNGTLDPSTDKYYKTVTITKPSSGTSGAMTVRHRVFVTPQDDATPGATTIPSSDVTHLGHLSVDVPGVSSRVTFTKKSIASGQPTPHEIYIQQPD